MKSFSLSLVFGAAMLMLTACGSDQPKPPQNAVPPPRTGPQQPQPTPPVGPQGPQGPQANNGGYGQPTDWNNFNGTLIGCDGDYCYYYVNGNYDYCGSYSSCTSGAGSYNWNASFWW